MMRYEIEKQIQSRKEYKKIVIKKIKIKFDIKIT